MLPLKLLHERYQRLDAFAGERVVNGSSDATDRSMALQAI